MDHARAKGSQKRGGDAVRVTFEELKLPGAEPAADLLALDEALAELAKTDARKGQVVYSGLFGGLSVEETAAVLGVSVDTVMRRLEILESVAPARAEARLAALPISADPQRKGAPQAATWPPQRTSSIVL